MGEITWTQIAIQLTGEAPASCKMTVEGELVVTLANGDRRRFTARQVDDTLADLDEIAKSQKTAYPDPPAQKTELKGEGEKKTSVSKPTKKNGGKK